LLEGYSISISELYQGLRDANHGEDNKVPACAGLRVLTEKLPGELKDIPWYAQEFLATRPRVVHVWLDYTNVKAGLAAALIGVPRIVLGTRSVAPNNFALFQPYMREGYRALAARPNVCLLNNSEAGARDYERWLGLPRGTFKVIRNGFDFSALEPADKLGLAQEFRTRLGVPLEAPIVGSVLRFYEEKRPLLWIDVAARVAERRPDVRFLIVGDGPLREEARWRALGYGLGDRIVMPGNEKDVAVAIAAMDVFLLTSRLEGFPNVLIEAQALGLPVITTDAGGAAETLIQGKTGYAISPHSPDLLADAVLRILGDHPWREAARQAAQRFVRERFSMSEMVDRTLDAYFGRGEFAQSPVKYNKIGDSSEALFFGNQMTAAGKRFEFGKNWKKYIERSFSQEKVEISKRHILAFLRRADLQGLTFLDIGCGSGLHSLAALQLGAAEVISFDYDKKSVEATNILYKYAGDPKNWKIMQGSVLDQQFMASLPTADIVYSWGVLHHTGDVWKAIRNAAVPVKRGGLFYIALYSADVHKDPSPQFWLNVKQRYLAASVLEKRKMEWWYVWRFQMGYKISALGKVLRDIIEYKKSRGMSYFTDIRDWLGGWPMEFCYDDDVKKFITQELGMELINIKTGEANTEFLFRRP
jgi:2-polyprenyl-6-hydroxyphenyl methylase/3-demethylubiquinone-9 3-methyltransferase